MSIKNFVDVVAKFNTSGMLMPISVIWKDGRTFEIDKVLEVTQRASMKSGGSGTRYLCKIFGKRKYLFFEDNKWYVE